MINCIVRAEYWSKVNDVCCTVSLLLFFFFQAEDGIRDWSVTGVQTCALPIYSASGTQTILATLAQRLGVSMDGIDSSQAARQPARQPARARGRSGGGISLFTIVIIGFVLFAIIRGLFGGGRGGGGGRWGGIGSNWLLWAILFGSGRGGGGWGSFGGGGDSGWGGGGHSGGGGGFGGF